MAQSQDTTKWRKSTREEVVEYYNSEFPGYIDAIPDFIGPQITEEFAISFGGKNYYPVRGDKSHRNFIRRQTYDGGGNPVFASFQDLIEFVRSPAHADPLRDVASKGYLAEPATVDVPVPIPRAVYYSLQDVHGGWTLAFDIDAKDIALDHAKRNVKHDDQFSDEEVLVECGIKHDAEPAGFNYAFNHIDFAIDLGFKIKNILETTYGFDDTLVVYSGQGVHVYGLDKDRFHKYDQQSRKVITYHLVDQLGYPLDRVVTESYNRVLRLPYSLHSDVSRVVTPLRSQEFDPRTDALPAFLTDTS
jgi:DNA primase catalytic subunit